MNDLSWLWMVLARPLGVVTNAKDLIAERQQELSLQESCARADAALAEANFRAVATEAIHRRFRKIAKRLKVTGLKLLSVEGTTAIFEGSKYRARLTMNEDGLTFRLHLFQGVWFLAKYSGVVYEKLPESKVKNKLRDEVV